MTLGIAALFFVATAVGFFALAVAWLEPTSPVGVRLKVLLGAAKRKPASRSERIEKVLEPLARALPRSPDRVSKTVLMLMQAGFRESKHLTIYTGTRLLLAGLCFVVAFVTGWGLKSPLLLIALPLLGFMLPRFIVARKRNARQTRIRLALPDALDLLTICVEAGLGLDHGIKRVGDELNHTHHDLSTELDLANIEVRAGKPRSEALRNLALRTGVDDVKTLVAVLVQTDRFGTSVAQALRVHSDSLRTERRQRAEEAAAKTTIKMVPVLVFFLFPSMFIVTIGPAAIQMIRNLLPAIQK
jgi:tight adherence protein C